MSNQIIGRIKQICPTQSFQTRDGSRTITKRELIIDATKYDGITGERGFENYPSFEFANEKCAELDKFKEGDIVTVSFDINGFFYTKQGETEQKHMNKITGFRCEPFTPRGTVHQTQQQAEYAPPTPPTGNFPPAVDAHGNPTEEKKDDLPF